jgi:hypothetical protein
MRTIAKILAGIVGLVSSAFAAPHLKVTVEYKRDLDEVVVVFTNTDRKPREVMEVGKNFYGSVLLNQGGWEGVFVTRHYAHLLSLNASYAPERVTLAPTGKREYRLSSRKDLVLVDDPSVSLHSKLDPSKPFTITAREHILTGAKSQQVWVGK